MGEQAPEAVANVERVLDRDWDRSRQGQAAPSSTFKWPGMRRLATIRRGGLVARRSTRMIITTPFSRRPFPPPRCAAKNAAGSFANRHVLERRSAYAAMVVQR
jgi:hypothetical protein